MIEVELRLPTKHQYAYVNVKIQGETAEAVSLDLLEMQAGLIEKITSVYNDAINAVQPSTSRASVAKTQAKVDAVVDTPKPTANELIKSELGGVVIEEIAAKKPWERAKPATAAAIEDF